MNKVMNLFDGVTPRDATTLNTSIDIRCLETGEVIFKGLKNKVVVAGSGLIAHSLFDIESGEVTPSYDSKIPGFVNITDPAPDSSPINETSATKSNPKVVLESSMVSNTPSISKPGLSFFCANIIEFKSCIIPSSAKNSHCTGIKTEFAAVRALVVNNPNDGGQSIIMKS